MSLIHHQTHHTLPSYINGQFHKDLQDIENSLNASYLDERLKAVANLYDTNKLKFNFNDNSNFKKRKLTKLSNLIKDDWDVKLEYFKERQVSKYKLIIKINSSNVNNSKKQNEDNFFHKQISRNINELKKTKIQQFLNFTKVNNFPNSYDINSNNSFPLINKFVNFN